MRTPGLESVSRAEPTARPRGTGGQDPPGPRGWRPGVQPPSHPRPAWAQGAGGLGCSHLLLCSQCSESLLCRTRPSVRACVAQAQVCSGKSGLTPAPSVLFLPSSCKSSSEEAGFVSPLAPLSRVHGTCFLDAGQLGAHTLSTLCF